MRHFGLLLLSIWLCLNGAKTLFTFYFPYDHWVIPGIALLSGVVLFLNSLRNLFDDLGFVLLSLWLILFGAIALSPQTYAYSEMSLAILGFVTAFFILIKR